ncbi:MAG: MBL fold metallo-hydrolase [Myxococcales bacterium]|nr:MBL fold metallo-hydrolase [Myxococcales bacterium]
MRDAARLGVRKPLLARWLAPAGPAEGRRVTRAGADVLAVPGRYCVTYILVAPGGLGIVDAGSQADVPLILEAIEWLGRSPGDVRWVMPSHLHFDHVMGLDALARRLGAPIALGTVAHATVTGGRAPRFPAWPYLWRAVPTWPMQGMPFPPREDWREGLDFGFPWGRNRFRAPLLPPIAHGAPLPGFPGWRLWDGPGHADDAILLHHEEAGFLVCGDTVRNFFGGEWNPLLCDRVDERLTRALIRSLHVTAIFPGHGPIVEGSGVVERLRRLPPWMP